MPDEMDQITDNAEREHALNYQRSQSRAENMPGPIKCLRCSERNDRSKAGFGICTDCLS